MSVHKKVEKPLVLTCLDERNTLFTGSYTLWGSWICASSKLQKEAALRMTAIWH